MSAPLTTRDALTAALAEALHGLRFGAVPPEGVDPYAREDAAHLADALLASGALIDATKLAEDEALVERVTPRWHWDGSTEQERLITVQTLQLLGAALSAR